MRLHWAEYGAEFAGVAVMLLIGLSAVTLNFADGSPVPDWLPNEHVRRLITGTIFAGGATAVVYSPLGKRSGAHLNPAVTLAFYRLGKIARLDAAAYLVAQVAGAIAGSSLVLAMWGGRAASVDVGATLPGTGGPAAATVAEVVITFLLVTLILNFVDRVPIAPYTGIAAGALVALLVFVEGPVSGTSLNPARSLAPAILIVDYRFIWIYLGAPLIGALLAVWLFTRSRTTTVCAKLYHPDAGDCIFACAYRAPGAEGLDG